VALWFVSLLFLCLYVFHNLFNTHIVAVFLHSLVCVNFFSAISAQAFHFVIMCFAFALYVFRFTVRVVTSCLMICRVYGSVFYYIA
jgi:hypothetical protein